MYKSPVLISTIFGLGMFLSTFDSGIMYVSLPFFSNIFGVSLVAAGWSSSIYALTLMFCILFFGKLADKHGSIRIYSMGAAILFIGSVLAVTNQVFWIFLLSRVIQAVGAAAIQATSLATAIKLVDKKYLSFVVIFITLLAGFGVSIGSATAGYILYYFSWYWLFSPIIILALIIFILSTFYWAYDVKHDVKIPFLGTVSFGAFIALFLLGISLITDVLLFKYAILALLISLVFLIVFIINEVFCKKTILEKHMYSELKFIVPILAVFLIGATFTLSAVITSVFFEKVLNLSANKVSIAIMLLPIAFLITSVILMRFMKPSRSTSFLLTGGIILLIPTVWLLTINLNWYKEFYIVNIIYGIGLAFFQAAAYTSLLSQTKNSLKSTVTAVGRMIQNSGIAVMTTVVTIFVFIFNYSSNSFKIPVIIIVAITLLFLLLISFQIFFKQQNKRSLDK